MNLDSKANNDLNFLNQPLSLRGWWRFDKDYSDASGNGNSLFEIGSPLLVSDSKLSGAVSFNGASQWLGTEKPIVDTEGSYTIAAWVRLDGSVMNNRLALKSGNHAFTAVSQDSPTHSAFYLGLRQIDKEQPDGVLTSSLRWNFTVSPIDGSETGPVEWQHAHAETHLDNSALDKWFLLVGVCDASNRTANIYVPNLGESGIIHWPDNLMQLRSDGGLQIGRGRWLGRSVDQWPGSIGPVKVFSGIMTFEDAKKLYTDGNL